MGQYSMAEALQQFLNESRIKGDVQAFQIKEAWESIMGKTIARYTDTIKIFGDRLIISTSVGPLKNELHFQKESIIKRVNESMGAENPLVNQHYGRINTGSCLYGLKITAINQYRGQFNGSELRTGFFRLCSNKKNRQLFLSNHCRQPGQLRAPVIKGSN
ncbi:MAG: DUF721 domain-containing protein [Chitinophagia bacterium]|nr:DUF721 domain-containing protein [Chitinophagia bacterium]